MQHNVLFQVDWCYRSQFILREKIVIVFKFMYSEKKERGAFSMAIKNGEIFKLTMKTNEDAYLMFTEDMNVELFELANEYYEEMGHDYVTQASAEQFLDWLVEKYGQVAELVDFDEKDFQSSGNVH